MVKLSLKWEKYKKDETIKRMITRKKNPCVFVDNCNFRRVSRSEILKTVRNMVRDLIERTKNGFLYRK